MNASAIIETLDTPIGRLNQIMNGINDEAHAIAVEWADAKSASGCRDDDHAASLLIRLNTRLDSLQQTCTSIQLTLAHHHKVKGTRIMTMADIKVASAKSGHYWFEPPTIQFFQSQIDNIIHQGPGGVFFVSSEQQPSYYDCHSNQTHHFDRRYSIRQFHPATNNISTAGKFQQYPTSREAHNAAKQLAAQGDQSCS